MFSLELDLRIYFHPLMEKIGGAITVTKTIKIPFTPHEGLMIAGSQIDDAPEPMGFKLWDLTWDMDRNVFLAHTFIHCHDFALATIPEEIGRWIELGWRFGSFMDAYRRSDELESADEDETTFGSVEDCDWEEVERWPTMSPRRRPAHFNKLLRALVRTMVELDNNPHVAYAIYRTKQFFTEEQQKDLDCKPARKFNKAQSEYFAMSFDEKIAWAKKVKRTFPKLKSIISTS